MVSEPRFRQPLLPPCPTIDGGDDPILYCDPSIKREGSRSEKCDEQWGRDHFLSCTKKSFCLLAPSQISFEIVLSTLKSHSITSPIFPIIIPRLKMNLTQGP